MTCKQCRTWQLVAVLEPERLTPAVSAAMAGHEADCADCRRSGGKLLLVHETLSPAPMPAGVTQQIHTNVMAAIRRRRKLRCVRKAVAWASAAAAVILVGIGVWHFRPGQRDTTSNNFVYHKSDEKHERETEVSALTLVMPEKPKALSEVEESALALAFDQAADAKSAFRLLNDAYDEAANRPEGGDFRDILGLCDKHWGTGTAF